MGRLLSIWGLPGDGLFVQSRRRLRSSTTVILFVSVVRLGRSYYYAIARSTSRGIVVCPSVSTLNG